MFNPHSFPMMQHLDLVGITVAFRTIGFHTGLILNRLRNERQIADDNRTDDERRQEQDRKEEEARTQLQFVKRRLADLAEFERRARGKN